MLEKLNQSQKEAVKHLDGAMLILAGAGSGKTQTITTRLAYLISLGIPPSSTLTLTFTNKASNEMRQRALGLIKNKISTLPLLVTFHKFGLFFLKSHIEKLNRENNFRILDSDDRKKLFKTILKERNIKTENSPALILSKISEHKNSLSQCELDSETNYLFNIYQESLQYQNLVDFDDLLLLPYIILKNNSALREKISQKYRYIMVDEFQDTNLLQNEFLKLLASTHQNLVVVGDDDQSIYGWRGANIDNILNFPKQFKECKIVKLETNYRSTKAILDSANFLILNNKYRFNKQLNSFRGEGEEVKIVSNFNEKDEAYDLANRIEEILKTTKPKEIAILYRINSLSRSLEEGFTKAKIPFKIVGGLRFYERAEIKDILAYFYLFVYGDDFSFFRAINQPKRGIGKVSLAKLQEEATKYNLSFLNYIEEVKSKKIVSTLAPKLQKNLIEFYETIIYLKSLFLDKNREAITIFEDKIGIKDAYANDISADDRYLNIDEFYAFLKEQLLERSLEEIVEDIVLQSDQDNIEENAINLMSIHASKGLEFEYVFIIGLENSFMPVLGTDNMEEERRLAYVAITRAKSYLTLSYVSSRFYNGERKTLKKSMFLKEIKEKNIKNIEKIPFEKGTLVKHQVFGIGKVENRVKIGKDYQLTIFFAGGKRDIMSSFIEVLDE